MTLADNTLAADKTAADAPAASISLDDKYTQTAGRIYLSGVQALVRLPILQYERDRAAGLNTAGFISGYRGSPLGMYDHALWRARKHLSDHNIRFEPGLNEDLAATAVWGAQQVGLFPGATVDGVFGIWYGKGPGVDRSMDALKHANSAGTSPRGGVLAFAGDDHGCQSSTLAHQSEQMFASALMPVINPANVQDYLDLGLYGFALSRYAGVWVGFKTIAETVESSASIHTDPDRIRIVTPTDFEMPPGGLSIRWPDAPLAQEARLHGAKMDAVAAFARANGLDRVVLDSPKARLGILATGKAFLDVRQALADLGIDDRAAAELGLRLYKVVLTWPLEAEGARRFAEGLQDVLVVEEKRGFIEDQLVRILYNMDASRRPKVVGKTDERGAPLLRSTGELSPTLVARAIVQRLKGLGHSDPALDQRLARLESFEALESAPSISKTPRTPYFCSGCPHNTSTKVPEGSRAMAGIGCHGMALSIPSRRTATISHMGGEGANWIGQAPFTNEKHIFQNLGDGTYTHSGLLAIRAAAAARVNITYKILYNDAVAMTGGQPAEGSFTVGQIAHQVMPEGVRKMAIVSDEPEKYPPSGYFPAGATIHHRRDLDAVQKDLRETSGLTVLIYDQTCAAEKRRRRKRGLYPDPPKRAFINDLVCESCGDCSEKSNCVSVRPLETELGRKRAIDQSNCNKDFSCVEGFCPSFVTVNGGGLRKMAKRRAEAGDDLFAGLPAPKPKPLTEPYGVLVTGIGGTGVITIGALLAMAAHVEGKGCTTLDFTGLSQKNGAVMSHVRLAPEPEDLAAVRIAPGGADLLLGCDMIVSASASAVSRLAPGVTRAVINGDLQPTAGFVMNPDIDFAAAAMRRGLAEALGGGLDVIDATGLAATLMGDSIASNPFILGYAWQKGLVPLAEASLMRAIELNGAAIEMNKQAFRWGRLAAHDIGKVQAAVRGLAPPEASVLTLDEKLARRAAFLTDYQNEAWTARWRALADAARDADALFPNKGRALTEAVAEGFFKLMSYKDEYEVARLYSNGAFREKLERQFDGDYRLTFHLAPPILARRDPATGHLQKRAFGPWMMKAFGVLARFKGLRGGAFDLFGKTEERRMERRLIEEYEARVRGVLGALTAEKYALAVQIAAMPQQMRGYGHIKEANVKKAEAETKRLMDAFAAPTPVLRTAAE